MTDSNFEKNLFERRVIDNRKVSMIDALKFLLAQPEFKTLDIAVGYFYISGLLLLKEEVTDFIDNRNGHLRVLMGNETNGATVNVLANTHYDNYVQLMEEKTKTDATHISDKDFMGKVMDWVQKGKIEVKVYIGEANYFHAKSYLFAKGLEAESGTAIVGSSNMSQAGLEGNTELNVLTQDGFFALHNWYNDLWLSEDEVTDFSPDLIKIVKANGAKQITQQYKPVAETYYDFANMYAHPYTELDTKKKWVQDLFPHQRSGVVSIKEKLDSFDTAVLSDGVGLGKTRTAAGVIRLYLASEAVNNILIVADTKLQAQWKEELAAVGVEAGHYSFVSRQKLVGIPNATLKKNTYTLMVIDEAHLGFKNNNTEAYRKVALMKRSNPKLKGLMMTATPWNNQREDVINIGSLFINVDAIPNNRDYKQYFLLSPHNITNKVVKCLARDDQAFKQFWNDIYLQRTRKTYGGHGASFPHRNFPSPNIAYEPRKDQIFADNFDIIADLKFPYQDPIKYIDPSREGLGAKQLKMLLLKRADSSWMAFSKSLQNIANKLQHLNRDYLLRLSDLSGKKKLNEYKNFLRLTYDITSYEDKNDLGLFEKFDMDNDDGTTTSDDSEQTPVSKLRKRQYIESLKSTIDDISLSKAKNAIAAMIADCKSDLDTLNMLIDTLDKSYSRVDEKVDKIIECVDKERKQGHKVILISQFADTVEYYYRTLFTHYNQGNQINYPMGMITGGSNTDKEHPGVLLNDHPSTKREVLDHFSPRSKGMPQLIEDNSEIDLVIGTDTISTGQNLQDAVTLMNIDLPYNPMVLEQRIGRIDRPLPKGKKNGQIYIYTFPVYQSINSQLKMLTRLGDKIKGAVTDTDFDTIVLPEYRDYLKDIQAKKQSAVKVMLDRTDAKLIGNTDFSSEEHSEQYREANRRMYNFKTNQMSVLKDPIVPNYSFSNGKDRSVAIVKVNYHDANNAYLTSKNILVDLQTGQEMSVLHAEQNLDGEISFDVYNTATLPKDKALLYVHESGANIKKAVLKQLEQYNEHHKFFAANTSSLNNATAKTAARKLRESAENNPEMVQQKLTSVHVDPSRLVDIVKYVETIDSDDELFEMVKEIANNPDVFWMNIKDYIDFFNEDKIKDAEQVGKNIQKIDTRQADRDYTNWTVLSANIVVNE